MRLGIDFGTTRTVVAVVDRGNYPVVGFETGDGQVVDHWPTMLAVHPGGRTPGKRLYGWDALAKVGVRGWTVHRSLKRLLATARHDDHVQVGKDEVSVLDVVTGFLTALRHDVLHRSNLPVTLAEGEALEVMIAVPAGATSAQRFLMMDACRAAGFTVVGLLNEPSAAGVEYAHRYRKTLTATREDVLVYDLGGGTFDVSLVRMGDGQHEVVAHAGDNHLGGDDFDAALLQLAAERAGRDPAAWSADERTALLEHCRAQKERLTPSSKKVVLELDEETSVTVTTADYYAACEPLVARTLETAARVLPHGGDDAFPTLAGVYVTGGASDLPVVARKLKEVYGARVKRSAYASASTAVGLAIAFEEAPRLLERFSRTFGVFRERESGTDVAFDALLEPATATGEPLVRRYRAAHNVGCFRYAECDRLEGGLPVGDLLPWGLLRFPFDPALRDADLDDVVVTRLDGRGPMVEERYEVLPTGLVEVHITDLDSGYARRHVFGQLGA
jgi:molecular chaperone DnaK (HSP70)